MTQIGQFRVLSPTPARKGHGIRIRTLSTPGEMGAAVLHGLDLCEADDAARHSATATSLLQPACTVDASSVSKTASVASAAYT